MSVAAVLPRSAPEIPSLILKGPAALSCNVFNAHPFSKVSCVPFVSVVMEHSGFDYALDGLDDLTLLTQ